MQLLRNATVEECEYLFIFLFENDVQKSCQLSLDILLDPT